MKNGGGRRGIGLEGGGREGERGRKRREEEERSLGEGCIVVQSVARLREVMVGREFSKS